MQNSSVHLQRDLDSEAPQLEAEASSSDRLFVQLLDTSYRHRILETSEMHRAVAREKERAHRQSICFSLIVFSRPDEPNGKLRQNDLDIILSRPLRLTDEIGWLNETQLAVLLSGSNEQDAWQVASEICEGYEAEAETPQTEVFYYPGRTDFKAVSSDSATASQKSSEIVFIQQMPRWKRAFDVLAAGSGLFLLWPLMAMIAILIRATSTGPIFYRQERRGLAGCRFMILKFRSMIPNADANREDLLELSHQDGPAFKLSNDPRVTPIGRFLRQTSLDELPQLWNVLVGEMSMVGPRPLPTAEADGCNHWQRQRLEATPGLTGVWQVYGRSRVKFDEWVRMDLHYIRNRRFFFDLYLILATIPALLLRRGAH